jgi:hypothetical protein
MPPCLQAPRHFFCLLQPALAVLKHLYARTFTFTPAQQKSPKGMALWGLEMGKKRLFQLGTAIATKDICLIDWLMALRATGLLRGLIGSHFLGL